MINHLKKFKVLGITRDFNVCDCCGKQDLMKTVAILDLEFETVCHFGVICAAAIDKYDTLDAAKLAKKEIGKAVRQYDEIEKNAASRAHKKEACVNYRKENNLFLYSSGSSQPDAFSNKEYMEIFKAEKEKIMKADAEFYASFERQSVKRSS